MELGKTAHNKKILLIVAVISLLLCKTSKSQNAVITGKVTWADNNKPVINSEVGLLMTPHLDHTNDKGVYRLDSVKPGRYKLRVFLFGYESPVKKVKVDSGITRINFQVDTLSQDLDVVNIRSKKAYNFGIRRLRSVEGTGIYSGKKTEVISVKNLTANKAVDKSRQVFAKSAGVHVWESDGAGVQLDVGSRGLNPKRTANFNTRQNGYDISADALGYPETYYSPPTEALEEIEIVRGAASLQYGPQFGGMINFKFKEPPENDIFRFNTRQTVGSFGLLNTYNSFSGSTEDDKLSYFTFYKFKRGNGWRPNSEFRVHNALGSMNFKVNQKLSLSLELTKMNSLAQQPGGLTDRMFEEDPTQSIRDRNWFRVDWNMAALKLNYRFSDRLKLNMRNFGLLGSRYALGFLGRITRLDHGEERQLLKDHYKNYGNETRLLYNYQLNGNNNALLIGSRYYEGFTDRKQGFGNDGKGPVFDFINPDNLEHSSYDFPSRNIALFAENKFSITPEFSITPGIRFEHIKTAADGKYKQVTKDLAGNVIFEKTFYEERERIRDFVLLGLGLSYKPETYLEFYGNFSENYRAISFNDMRIINPNLRVDSQLADESGFTGDIGVRGQIANVVNYDVSAFGIAYEDKIGSILKVDEELFRTYRYRTNIADARHYGIEGYAEIGLIKLLTNSKAPKLSFFTNFSFLNAEYVNSEETGIEGNKVEYAPPFQLKTGLNFEIGRFKASYQFSYSDDHYSDATNAEQTASAIHGTIPAYHVMDISLAYQYRFLNIEGGLNNLTDHQYFTRRATGYPGPGIIPSKGRSFYLTVGAEF